VSTWWVLSERFNLLDEEIELEGLGDDTDEQIDWCGVTL